MPGRRPVHLPAARPGHMPSLRVDAIALRFVATSLPHLVVLSGAGMSAESGVKTFRDNNGLWEEHRVEDVATPQAFARDPELVMRFYNLRRAQLATVEPNRGHRIIAELERDYRVSIVTQNVDDLHERAGSTHVLHLHGELTKVRPVDRENDIRPWQGDLKIGDTDGRGVQLRPHVVWFGEAVPAIEEAAGVVATANVIVIVGTSMQVYPAAGLVSYAPPTARIFYVDPRPAVSYELQSRDITYVKKGAGEGMETVCGALAEG